MVSRLLVVVSVLWWLTGPSSLGAEDSSPDWFFRALQTEDGLPDNTINGIAQSSDGYLWVGTNGGAMRFNGNRFSLLPLRGLPGLPSQAVQAMHLDRSGQLWLALSRGPVFRIGEDSVRAFGLEDGLMAKRVVGIMDDPDGRVWIGYAYGVCRIDGDEVVGFPSGQQPPLGGYGSFACDAEGNVWFAIGERLGTLGEDGFETVRRFRGLTPVIAAGREAGIWLAIGGKLQRMDSDGNLSHAADLLEGAAVGAILEDRDGAVWLGTENLGLLRVEGGSVERVATSHRWVSCIIGDREGNIWAGTRGGGLNLIRPRIVDFIEGGGDLPLPSVASTACDLSGRLWAVGQDGRLGYREDGRWHLESRCGAAPTCVTADARGRIWVGTHEQGILRIDGDELRWFGPSDGLGPGPVRSMLAASNGDLWAATDNPDRLYLVRDGRVSLLEHGGPIESMRAMAEGADGTIWVGTSDGRLFRVQGDRMIDESDLDGPLHLSIRTLHASADGSLWIGYAGDGLGLFKEGRYTRFTTENGLFDDYVSQIQEDGSGSLWIAANRGLFQVEIRELRDFSADAGPGVLTCRVFGRNEGVPSIQPSRNNAPTSCRGPDGHLFFPTHSGIVEVRPDKLRLESLPPPVVLEKVTLDNRTVAVYPARSMLGREAMEGQIDLSLPGPGVELPPDHERLVVHVAALSLASPENVRLRYRLLPMDENWEEVENGRSVTFPRLPAGRYRFQVIACNNAGVWNHEGAVLGIYVEPHFWETWWFKLGGALCTALAGGGLVFLGLRWRHRLQLQRIAAKHALEQERSRIARDIHDDLGANLTRITLLSQSESSPLEAGTGKVLEQIHATARHLMRSMEEVVWAVNPEYDTFDALANYLGTYGQGFLNVAGVRCRLELPMVLPEPPLPAQIRHNLFLAYKEALNNAVKHSGATEVRISLEPGLSTFVLRVEDNGKGIDPAASADPMRPTSGSGLANMKSRMDEIGGTCTLRSTVGQGTTVEFEVPYGNRQ